MPLRFVCSCLKKEFSIKHTRPCELKFSICLQGEKGEPGLIVGPDGNPFYLGGSTGSQVSMHGCLYIVAYICFVIFYVEVNMLFTHCRVREGSLDQLDLP